MTEPAANAADPAAGKDDRTAGDGTGGDDRHVDDRHGDDRHVDDRHVDDRHVDDRESLLGKLDELISLRGLKHAEQSLVGHVVPAWRRQTPGERRTAVTVAIVVAIGLIIALPPRVENRPRLLLPGLALLMLIGLVVANPGRLERRSKWIRRASLTLIGVISIANAASGRVWWSTSSAARASATPASCSPPGRRSG